MNRNTIPIWKCLTLKYLWSKFMGLICCLQVVFAWIKAQICPIKKYQYEKCVIWGSERTRQISVLSWERKVAGFKWHRVLENVHKKSDEWYIEWQPEVQKVATNYREWQGVATGDNAREPMTTSDNKWQRLTMNGNNNYN